MNSIRKLAPAAVAATLCLAAWGLLRQAQAQNEKTADSAASRRSDDADRKAAEALAAPSDKEAELPVLPSKVAAGPENLFDLWWEGGLLMYPITFMSFLVVVFAVERAFGLRRNKILPRQLTSALSSLATRPENLDLRQAYSLCQQHPSAAANVLRAVLLKIGRPHAELEAVVTETSQREGARMYKNVRVFNLATTITPLLGLLGTVQGMIACFMKMANLDPADNQTAAMATGIYIALLTTFGGLVVAIPSAVLGHYFEGRLQSLFREMQEWLTTLLPQFERYEGKIRVGRHVPGAEREPREHEDSRRVPAALELAHRERG